MNYFSICKKKFNNFFQENPILATVVSLLIGMTVADELQIILKDIYLKKTNFQKKEKPFWEDIKSKAHEYTETVKNKTQDIPLSNMELNSQIKNFFKKNPLIFIGSSFFLGIILVIFSYLRMEKTDLSCKACGSVMKNQNQPSII